MRTQICGWQLRGFATLAGVAWCLGVALLTVPANVPLGLMLATVIAFTFGIGGIAWLVLGWLGVVHV